MMCFVTLAFILLKLLKLKTILGLSVHSIYVFIITEMKFERNNTFPCYM